MGEMIQLQIGQTGNRIGYCFWQQLIKQHNIDKDGKKNQDIKVPIDKSNLFFEECNNNIYKPRSLFIDTQSNSIQDIMRSSLNNLFGLQNFCHSGIQTRNLWPIGYNSNQYLKSNIEDSLRRQVESCDLFAGFNTIFSISGGAGSGLSSFITNHIQQQYTYQINLHSVLIPSPVLSNCVVQLYNLILALQKLNNSTQPCILFQNQAIFKLNKNEKQKQAKNFQDVNKIIAKGMVNLTSPMRFPCDGNITIRKMCNNLIRFPMQKYFTMGMPCQQAQIDKYHQLGNVIKWKIMNYNNCSLTFTINKTMKHKFIANYFIYRGNKWNPLNINYEINKQFNKNFRKNCRNKPFKDQFIVDKLIHSYMASVVRPENKNASLNNSITAIQHSSAIKYTFNQLQDKTSAMRIKRAFMHNYESQGVTTDDINEAQNVYLDIINYYQTLVEDNDCCNQEGIQ